MKPFFPSWLGLGLTALSLLAFSCGSVDASKPPCGLTDSVCTSCPTSATPLKVASDMIPFGLCLSGMTPANQVAYLRKIGYTGMGLQGLNAAEFRAFGAIPEVASGAFKLPSALWWASVLDPVDSAWLDPILIESKKLGVQMWMVSEGPNKSAATVAKAVAMYRRAAVLCKARGVQLVIYPHEGCVVETAEEALAMRDTLVKYGHPEVKISIHLSHEIRLGNEKRLGEIIPKVAPHLALVSFNGADSGATDWETGIQPLDQGNFNIVPFLAALLKAGYTGPLELHTYGLKNPEAADYDKHLERSWKCWKQLVAPRDTTPKLPVSQNAPSTSLRPTISRSASGELRVWGLAPSAQPRLYQLNGREIAGRQVQEGVWAFLGVPRGVGVLHQGSDPSLPPIALAQF
jgi:sugar phosphate isomerase/epimerase